MIIKFENGELEAINRIKEEFPEAISVVPLLKEGKEMVVQFKVIDAAKANYFFSKSLYDDNAKKMIAEILGIEVNLVSLQSYIDIRNKLDNAKKVLDNIAL